MQTATASTSPASSCSPKMLTKDKSPMGFVERILEIERVKFLGQMNENA